MTDKQLDEFEALADTETKVAEVLAAHRRAMARKLQEIERLKKKVSSLKAELELYKPKR